MNVIFLILFVVLIALGVSTVLRLAPKYGPAFLTRISLILLAVGVVVMALTGRMHWLVGLFAGVLPFIRRLLPLLLPLIRFIFPLAQARQQQKNKRQHSSGQQSEITTLLLKMSLDHDSGTMEGEIIAGPFQGRRLQQLTMTELHDFYQQCQQQDNEGLRLLESYIQRHCQQPWNDYQQSHGSQQQSASNSSEPSIEEALDILGLKPGASRDAIITAHKRMMIKVHPDKGGSNYLASKINQAKEILLKH